MLRVYKVKVVVEVLVHGGNFKQYADPLATIKGMAMDRVGTAMADVRGSCSSPVATEVTEFIEKA